MLLNTLYEIQKMIMNMSTFSCILGHSKCSPRYWNTAHIHFLLQNLRHNVKHVHIFMSVTKFVMSTETGGVPWVYHVRFLEPNPRSDNDHVQFFMSFTKFVTSTGGRKCMKLKHSTCPLVTQCNKTPVHFFINFQESVNLLYCG